MCVQLPWVWYIVVIYSDVRRVSSHIIAVYLVCFHETAFDETLCVELVVNDPLRNS